jgi:phage shock protein PspC (stress-responsive transcriptional regulator)
MENWYLPITIIPGIGLIVLSTSNLMVALSNELDKLISTCKDDTIINRKMAQLKLLNKAMVCFYVAIALLLISGIIAGINDTYNFSTYLGILAIVVSTFGLISLIIYSIRSVNIHQNQFKSRSN